MTAESNAPRLSKLLPESRILVDVSVADWRAAVRVAGTLLEEAHLCEPRYLDAMLRVVDELGPYIVIAPHVALPHAQSRDGALGTGFSLVRLEPPIDFGNASHDPVRLVFGLVADAPEAHLEAMRDLAELLSMEARRERLLAATTTAELHALLATPQSDE